MAISAVMTQLLLQTPEGSRVPAVELLMIGYGARQHIRKNALQYIHHPGPAQWRAAARDADRAEPQGRPRRGAPRAAQSGSVPVHLTGVAHATGLTSQLRDNELGDLLAFLSYLGRDRSFAVPNVPYIRRYELMEGGTAISALIRERRIGVVARPDTGTFTWHRVYANIDGSLPTAELPTGTPDISYFAGQQFRAARFALEVLRAGKVTLAFDDPAGLELYVGERKIDPVGARTTFELPEGTHTVTVIVNRTMRGADTRLRIHLAEAPDTRARCRRSAGSSYRLEVPA